MTFNYQLIILIVIGLLVASADYQVTMFFICIFSSTCNDKMNLSVHDLCLFCVY